MKLETIINILEDYLEKSKIFGTREAIIRLKTKDISDLIHQLKAAKELKQELEVYKKALEMACATLSNFLYHHPENHIEEEMRGFLQKAREEQ